MVAFARKPGPRQPAPEAMPSCSAIGPLTTMAVPPGWVVIAVWKKRYSGAAIARIAASTTGKYSGRQPARTALTARLRTLIDEPLGIGGSMSTSSAASGDAASIAATRSSVGGTTGRPSPICSASNSS